MTCYDDGRSSTLTVTDSKTGNVIRRRQVKEKVLCVTTDTDTAGNIYICYGETTEVCYH